MKIAKATGCGAFVYSRAGYGKSDPIELPHSVRFMHEEALNVLPGILRSMQIKQSVLIGHSDGASIAIIYAGSEKRKQLRGLILEAPHVFTEEITLRSIAEAAEDYRKGDLRKRIERHHGRNSEIAFWGWNEVWLNPEFEKWNIEEYLPKITVPALVIQGEEDNFGTLKQVRAIERASAGPVETLILPDCGHRPHRDQPEQTFQAITSFIRRSLLKRPHET